jgi:hypothetical protein
MSLMGMPSTAPGVGTDFFRNVGMASHPMDLVETKDAFKLTCDAPGGAQSQRRWSPWRRWISSLRALCLLCAAAAPPGGCWRLRASVRAERACASRPAGMAPEDIKVEFDNGVLTISGQKKMEREEKDKEGKVRRAALGCAALHCCGTALR